MVDRFLRMLQSRHSVDVLSAKILESGSLHLRIAARRDINTQGTTYILTAANNDEKTLIEKHLQKKL